MRACRVALLCWIVCAAAFGQQSDEISWVRQDGTPGWRTGIPQEIRPPGRTPAPFLAPRWFAKFPDAKLKLASGGVFDFAAARGKIVLVDFWASWCGPCLKELPHLQRLHATREARGLRAIAINADEEAPAASQAARRLGLSMPVAVNDPALYRTLGVHALPTLMIIDRQGRLRARWDGYRPGLEAEIAATVDRLLGSGDEGETRELASTLAGGGVLAARWARDLPGSADGVVGLPPGTAGGVRVVASAGGMLLSFDAAGEAVARRKSSGTLGRLLDFGTTGKGTREIVGFRPGGTSIGVVTLDSGQERTIDVPAPVLDVAVQNDAPGAARHLAAATVRGAALAAAEDTHAALLDGSHGVRSLASLPGRGILSLREDGSIAALDAAAASWPGAAPAASQLLVARDDGAALGPTTAVGAALGRFLPGSGRQLAVATYAGHVVLLDAATGGLLFDAVWADVRDLSAADLDGDGLDELLIASGRSVAALGATRDRVVSAAR
ncbi:MAG TPA: TlpA disulfide reductase family protein [Candidatus Polarisedimenticolaceae bacterium]|nr:TlpA disulfide reductase family protein [Candidatus Polarisedimenticolaceae bacterium]